MKNKIILLVMSSLLFTGCAFHGGYLSPSAAISNKNFKMVKYAEGSASTLKFLGIGGLSKNALVAEAKRNLLQKNPLTEGQALANVSVDFKTSFLILVVTDKVTVTADIIEFQ